MLMIKRLVLIGFALLPLVIGVGAASDQLDSQADIDAEIETVVKSDTDVETRIFQLRKIQRKYKDVFSPKLHNELRHCYATSDQPAEAMQECELLLANSVMDAYILNILSDWELDKHRNKAIANLLRSARTAQGCNCVKAACWARVGDLYRDAGAPTSAAFYYHIVLTQDSNTASAYHALAEQRLGLVD